MAPKDPGRGGEELKGYPLSLEPLEFHASDRYGRKGEVMALVELGAIGSSIVTLPLFRAITFEPKATIAESAVTRTPPGKVRTTFPAAVRCVDLTAFSGSH